MAASIVQGILAGLAGIGFVLTFLFAQTRRVSLPVLLGLAIASIIALFAAGGRSAVLRLSGRTETTDTIDAEGGDWWLARVEPALEASWNTWSDLILTIGLGVVGIGAFGLLVTHPEDDPPLGLLIVGFLGINGALISLVFTAD